MGIERKKEIQNYSQKIRQRIRTTLTFAAFIVLLTSLFLLLAVRKSSEVKSARSVVQESKQINQKQKAIQALIEKYKNKGLQIENLYPNENTIVQFVKKLEDIGYLATEDFEFSFDQQSPRKDANQYSYLSYTLRMRTDLNGLLVFLDRFENLPFLSRINLIQAQELSNFNSEGVYIIKANIYVAEPFSI